jgi:hypothetical protein
MDANTGPSDREIPHEAKTSPTDSLLDLLSPFYKMVKNRPSINQI